MRLGMVSSVDDAAAMRDAGFDYLDVNIVKTLAGTLDDSQWRPPTDLALPAEAGAVLLPPELPVVGPQRDVGALTQYMQRVARRAGQLGIKVLVFGSGKARRRPDDVTPDQAMRQIVEFCRLAGDACAEHDITLAVEHLKRPETNTINTLGQLHQVLEKVDHPRVAALVDSYHFGLEPDNHADDLLSLGGRIAHVHLAEPSGRHEPGQPAQPEQAFDFEDFFSLLRKAGYDGRFSLEVKLTGPIDQVCPPCLATLRQTWDASAAAV